MTQKETAYGFTDASFKDVAVGKDEQVMGSIPKCVSRLFPFAHIRLSSCLISYPRKPETSNLTALQSKRMPIAVNEGDSRVAQEGGHKEINIYSLNRIRQRRTFGEAVAMD